MGDIYTAADIVYGLLFTAAVGMVALSHHEMRAARICLGLGGLLMASRWFSWAFTVEAPWGARAVIGGLVGAVLLAGMPALWQWSVEKERAAKADQTAPALSKHSQNELGHSSRLPTMKELFAADFVDGWGLMRDIEIADRTTSKDFTLSARSILNSDSHTKIFAIYIPKEAISAAPLLATFLIEHPEMLVREMDTVQMGTSLPGDPPMVMSDKYLFARVLYFYTDEDLPLRVQADLLDLAKLNNMTVYFRGSVYFALNLNNEPLLDRIKNQAKAAQSAPHPIPAPQSPPEKK